LLLILLFVVQPYLGQVDTQLIAIFSSWNLCFSKIA